MHSARFLDSRLATWLIVAFALLCALAATPRPALAAVLDLASTSSDEDGDESQDERGQGDGESQKDCDDCVEGRSDLAAPSRAARASSPLLLIARRLERANRAAPARPSVNVRGTPGQRAQRLAALRC